MSSRIFQSVIVQMKEATKRLIGVIDSDGTVVASSELALVGSNIGVFPAAAEETGDKVVKNFGRTFKMLGNSGPHFDYAVFVDGEDDFAKTICIMAYIAISEAKVYYEENHDKCAFVKNIISDKLLPETSMSGRRNCYFVTDITRIVMVIRQLGRAEVTAIELLQNMFPDKQHDFVISVSETDIALIKEINTAVDSKYVQKLAATIESKLAEELGLKTVIGIGTPQSTCGNC
jgi:carbohydrate diacid regulator